MKALAREAMRSAFGAYADAERLLYNVFDRNLGEIVAPNQTLPTVVLELMKWTDREGNLDAMICGLYDEFPAIPAVQVLFKFRFPDDPRAAFIRPAPFQPHLPCCPDEGLVLVGRDELQRAIMDRQPNAKNVIVVSGSGRSGKTFSGVVIGVLAPIFKYLPVIINQPANAKPEHVASSILRNVRASDALPPRNGDPIERWAETLAEWVSAQLRPTTSQSEPWWIVIDGCEHVDAEVITFLERLASRLATQLRGVARLALLGYTGSSTQFVRVERLRRLQCEDLALFFKTAFAHHQQRAGRGVIEAIIERVAASWGERDLAVLHDVTAQAIQLLLRGEPLEREWTLDDVARRLAPLEGVAPPTVAFDGFVDAAAVLVRFDPADLHPAGAATEERPPIDVLKLCTEELDGTHRFRLQRDVRQKALTRLLARNGVAAALAANPDRVLDSDQRMFERVLQGAALDVGALDVDELRAAVNAVDLLSGIVAGLPDRARLDERLAFEDLVSPLRALANRNFQGRAVELGVLTEHLANAGRTGTSRAPLLVFGPGGIGKSTLAARFILDRSSDKTTSFAYLDFDRIDLSIKEPMRLVAEIVRQVGIQYPTIRQRSEDTRAEILANVESGGGGFESISSRQLDVGQLVSLLREVGAADRPFVLVLDTFEEVQYTSGSYIESLWELFAVLNAALPGLAVIIVGRAPLGNHDTRLTIRTLELPELDRSSALAYLARRGVRVPAVAEVLWRHVGGSPLSLHLAAEAFGDASVDDVSALELAGNVQAQIQGQLYRRILGHIHDGEVRRLAHPGLVLRVVTPELIRQVLAETCGVAVADDVRARYLFDELAREVSLVQADGPDRLRHRADVRRVMLDLLTLDQPDRVAAIHRKAVAYYAARDGIDSRAEEIYHRLSLGEESHLVEQRWLPGVEAPLRTALSELPPRPRAYLSSKLGIDIDADARAAAAHSDWERDAQKRVLERLQFGREDQLREALAILAERTERTPDTPLLLLEAQVLERLDMLDRAATAAAAALVPARRRGGHAQREALRVAARIDEALQRLEPAIAKLGEALLVEGERTPVETLELELDRLRVLEKAQPAGAAVREARERIARLESQVQPEQLTPVLRSTLASIGIAKGSILDASVFPVTDPRAQELMKLMIELDPESPEILALAASAGIPPGHLWRSGSRRVSAQRLLEVAAAHRVTRRLVELVRNEFPDNPRVRFLDSLLRPPSATTTGPSARQREQLRSVIAQAFSRPELGQLVEEALDVRIHTITSSTGSFAQTVFEVVDYAISTERLLELVNVARVKRPGNAELDGLLQELFPATSAAQLDTAQANAIVADIKRAVLTAGLAQSRAALLSGIAAPIVAALPIQPNVMQQTLSDVGALVAANGADGSKPIAKWLDNAIMLAGHRPEADVFRRALAAL